MLGRDPLAALTRAPYAYAGDNPANSSDPSGLISLGGILSGIGTAVSDAWSGVNGAIDTLTSPLGLVGLPTSATLRDALGGLGVNTCGTPYHAGEIGGLFVGVLIPGEGPAEAASEGVAIGENMVSRVIPYAESHGLAYYTPPRLLRFAPQRVQLWHNRRWINGVMDGGRPIHDLGPDPGRSVRSIFYEMERSEILGRSYPNYLEIEGR